MSIPNPMCGTRAGYRFHVRKNKRPPAECQPCHEAELTYHRNARDPNHPDYRGDAINHKRRLRRHQKANNLPKINYRVRNETLKARNPRIWGWEYYTTEMILERWGTVCYLCNEEVDLEAPRYPGQEGWERGLHLDHVIPISKRGCDIIDNVKPTHGFCNLSKSDKMWLNGELV